MGETICELCKQTYRISKELKKPYNNLSNKVKDQIKNMNTQFSMNEMQIANREMEKYPGSLINVNRIKRRFQLTQF